LRPQHLNRLHRQFARKLAAAMSNWMRSNVSRAMLRRLVDVE
jgi:uncharacterized protein YjiS (DUF1127 family)